MEYIKEKKRKKKKKKHNKKTLFHLNQVAYKKRANKSLNNQRDQLVSENIFWNLFIGFETNSKMLWE